MVVSVVKEVERNDYICFMFGKNTTTAKDWQPLSISAQLFRWTRFSKIY